MQNPAIGALWHAAKFGLKDRLALRCSILQLKLGLGLLQFRLLVENVSFKALHSLLVGAAEFLSLPEKFQRNRLPHHLPPPDPHQDGRNLR